MRTVSDAALDMMMDVSNAKDENDQTIRVMRQITHRDIEVAEFVRANIQAEIDALKIVLNAGIEMLNKYDDPEAGDEEFIVWTNQAQKFLGKEQNNEVYEEAVRRLNEKRN